MNHALITRWKGGRCFRQRCCVVKWWFLLSVYTLLLYPMTNPPVTCLLGRSALHPIPTVQMAAQSAECDNHTIDSPQHHHAPHAMRSQGCIAPINLGLPLHAPHPAPGNLFSSSCPCSCSCFCSCSCCTQ